MLERDTSSLEIVKPPFPRMSYTEAVAELQGRGVDVEWGKDLGASDENELMADRELPLFVTRLSEAGEGLLHEGESRRLADRSLRRPARPRGVTGRSSGGVKERTTSNACRPGSLKRNSRRKRTHGIWT